VRWWICKYAAAVSLFQMGSQLAAFSRNGSRSSDPFTLKLQIGILMTENGIGKETEMVER
jgi:hypothetical protein